MGLVAKIFDYEHHSENYQTTVNACLMVLMVIVTILVVMHLAKHRHEGFLGKIFGPKPDKTI